MTMDEMKELREAHNRIRYLEARLELVSEDGRRLTESCDGIACRDDTIKLQDDRISRLTTEGKITRKFVERIAKQPLIEELPEDAEGGDPEGAYDAIVAEAREALSRVSGKRASTRQATPAQELIDAKNDPDVAGAVDPDPGRYT
jgi:hypothetical protein